MTNAKICANVLTLDIKKSFAIAAIVAASAMVALLGVARPAVAANGPAVSLSLQQALDLALVGNLSYRAAQADVRAAEARVVQAGAGRAPSLSAGYAYVHNQNAAFIQIPVGPGMVIKSETASDNINAVNATLQYAIYSGGAVQAAIGQATAGFAAAESQLAAARSTVVRDTTDAYFQLVEARRSVEIADQAVAVAQQNEMNAEELFRNGVAAKADVLREQVTLENARVQAIQAHNSADLANAGLANLLNVNLDSSLHPSEPLNVQPPRITLDDALTSAMARRPELAAAQDAVTIAQQAVRAARAGTLPTVALQVQDASTKPNFQNLPQPQLSETLSVTWKLFDGGLTRGKAAEASAQVDKAAVQLAQLRNAVDLEVRQAYFNYNAAITQVGAARAAQTSADESLRVSQLRFRSGVGTSLELSDALLAATQARLQYVNSLAGLRIALANLQRAIGQ